MVIFHSFWYVYQRVPPIVDHHKIEAKIAELPAFEPDTGAEGLGGGGVLQAILVATLHFIPGGK